ncbi:hypothetical protein [Streptococcus loxodontisalivarius]|uniref:Uncharacterized protein n=1 Tax=Streptococcus loxodontisalivarius TaxID=1349415 RepID=A0ABS2PUH4_9STRE|nr:hypothetical protein [Streptococcus loxodontisalivarius]MBM7643704.1 hypothetical protein [Streptococcus loxodontisalivarius]
MNTKVSVLLVCFVMLFIVTIFLRFFQRKANQIEETVYIIRFKTTSEKQNLTENRKLMSYINILSEDQQGYVVSSRISDSRLKQMIIETYNIDSNHVTVQSRLYAGLPL